MNFTLDYIATDFAVDLSNQYSLSIRQDQDGYSFCVVDETLRKCVAIKRIAIQKLSSTSDFFANEALLKLEYKKVNFIGYGAYTIIPNALVDEDNLCSYLPIEKNLQNRAKLHTNEVTDRDTIVCYTNQWQVPNMNCSKFHIVELLLRMGLECDEYESVWCDVSRNIITISIIRNGGIVLVNSYQATTKEDIYYYILACYQQFGLSKEKVKLHINGNCDEGRLDEFLKEYISEVVYEQPRYWNGEFDNRYAPYFTLLTNII